MEQIFGIIAELVRNFLNGEIAGTWEMKEGTCYMTLTYADITYSGVFCRMQDEAGTEVMTGDSERTACAIAAKVSVGEYHSEVFVGG